MTRTSMPFEVADAHRVVGAFDNVEPTQFSVMDLEDRDRSHHGKVLIWGYLLLVALVVSAPLTLWALISGSGTEFDSGLHDIQELTVAMLAGLSGVAALAGHVVGRYFNEKTTKQAKRRTR